MTKEEHLERHKALHKSLDELLCDFVMHTNRLPSETTLLYFMQWSWTQTVRPDETTPFSRPEKAP